MTKIIAIVGPTASGKTKLSIEIAKRYNGQCVNFDSTQLFSGTDIATNKITDSEKDGIVHHMLSVKKVNQTIDVVEYRNITREIINKLLNKKISPILVGGTGYYLLGVVKNYTFFGCKRKEDISKQFSKLNQKEVNELLFEDLLIKGTDNKRILRKYQLKQEVDMSKINFQQEEEYIYKNLVIIGLNPDREKLYQRINDRVLELVKIGLFDEIKKAYLDNDKNKDAQALKCIGGKEIIAYLNNQLSYEDAITAMQKNNRNYAKRQITYFKNKFQDKIKWFNHQFLDIDRVYADIFSYIDSLD
ncbi:tRNA (adenosine(37)-N6)-dimethylallyltransferase MiaA [Spiroplasma endosymbiont of Aspidapion aeneum]|uniref:tRNA (adenosine(37)-N6)-dimethylallyltransferase MiaA n=1 Tax=Spiroplasma endosymbiont of Aspidapion aeneum TaxID=3066276 RepID=UPI00313A8CCA